MLDDIIEDGLAPLTGIVQAVTGIIFGLYLAVAACQDLLNVQIKAVLLLCQISEKSIILFDP